MFEKCVNIKKKIRKEKVIMKHDDIVVKEVKPLLPKTCAVCRHNCFGETMWKIKREIFTSQGNVPDVFYICKICKPDKDVLWEIFKH